MHFSGHNPPLLLLLPSSILPGSHRGAVVRRWPSAVDGTLKMNPRSNYVEERFGPSEYTCMQRYTCDIFSTFRSHTYTQTHRHTCEHTETVSVYGYEYDYEYYQSSLHSVVPFPLCPCP